MAAGLNAYLRAARARTFAWGEWDCGIFWADWVRLSTGHDPWAGWRGTYASEAEAAALMAREGGLAAMFQKGLAGIDAPPPGAVVDSERGQAGAIPVGGSFAVLSERGLGRIRADLCRVVWSCPS